MKSRLTATLLSLLVAITFTTGFALADTLTLTKIGSFDLGGKKYPEWWYSGTNPTFYGKADNSVNVELTFKDKKYETQSDIYGDWYIPTAMDKGDYNIEITSGDASYNFTLHVGQDYSATTTATQASSSTTSVPSTGAEQTTALTLGLGVSLLALYLYFFDANKKHKIFEKKIVSDN
jgi:LPXTG-motif cell wall-anchored protein